MEEPTRYVEYAPGATCSVDGCTSPAEYEVYLYDYYESMDEEFFEQDFTCPYLCEVHMRDNESKMRGVRAPRQGPSYPFTNRHGAQGFAKYAPIADLFQKLYATSKAASSIVLIESVSAINEEIIRYLARHPEEMRRLQPRKFEELVAELLRDQGFHPTLTPQTRDGGRDIIAVRSDALGDHLYLVECKRYAPNRKVGVEQVRGIYGVAQAERATKAVLVTTSTFTADAISFASPLKYELGLKDYDALKTWITGFGQKT